jgi:hypothetical protein
MTRILLGLLIIAGWAFAQTHVGGNFGPSKVGGGPASNAMAPAGATTTTSTTTAATTTTTLAGASAPSWVAGMLAAWMLDSAAGTARVNANGNAALDLAETGASVANDTVNKQEGTASMAASTASGQALFSQNIALVQPTITAGLSWGCWARETDINNDSLTVGVFGGWANTGGGGYGIDWIDANNSYRALVRNAAGTFRFAGVNPNSAQGTWVHVVGAIPPANDTLYLFINGVQIQAQTGTAPLYDPASAAGFYEVGGLGAYGRLFQGNLDECFVAPKVLAAASVCRICSCGIRGELCTCSGTAFLSTGRNATACGSCSLPANCSAASPS